MNMLFHETIQDLEEVDHTWKGFVLKSKKKVLNKEQFVMGKLYSGTAVRYWREIIKASADCDRVIRKESTTVPKRSNKISIITSAKVMGLYFTEAGVDKLGVRSVEEIRCEELLVEQLEQKHGIVGASIRRCVVVDRKSRKLKWSSSLETLQSKNSSCRCFSSRLVWSVSGLGPSILQEAIEGVCDNIDDKQQDGFKGSSKGWSNKIAKRYCLEDMECMYEKGYRYFSELEAVDCFSQNWRGVKNYLYSPFAMIYQAIMHAKECGALIIIVAPVWGINGPAATKRDNSIWPLRVFETLQQQKIEVKSDSD
ncbi:46455_t:CDS:2 [Gigaspora margarita]|uniref:46455_t:CDS:1 n=1 Tax=Gigaspora margarita TaxID=4874 RepID=A0ABN7V7W2_GIGMA|nr:46455_t:CDS:2 [Gigaspora margarita]